MRRLLHGERCGDEPSLRRAEPADGGVALGSDERAGLAREQGRTRDAVSESGVGEDNTGGPRGVGEWAGMALIALWWGEETGVLGRRWQGGLPPSAKDLPTPATVCHQLPGTASLERGFRGIGAWAVDVVHPASGGECLDRRLGYEDRVSGRSSTAGGSGRPEKRGSHPRGPVTVCHIAVRGPTTEGNIRVGGAKGLGEETCCRGLGEVGDLRRTRVADVRRREGREDCKMQKLKCKS